MSVWCRHIQREGIQYKERECSPRDYSRQLAGLRWPVCHVPRDLSPGLRVPGWGCAGDMLTEGQQFRRAMAVLQACG